MAQKKPRRGGSVMLPKGASPEDIDNALRSPPKAGYKPGNKPAEEK